MRKAQLSFLFFLLCASLLLILLWGYLIGPMLTLAGNNAVAAGATGLEAFFWQHLNLWASLAVALCLGVVAYYASTG